MLCAKRSARWRSSVVVAGSSATRCEDAGALGCEVPSPPNLLVSIGARVSGIDHASGSGTARQGDRDCNLLPEPSSGLSPASLLEMVNLLTNIVVGSDPLSRPKALNPTAIRRILAKLDAVVKEELCEVRRKQCMELWSLLDVMPGVPFIGYLHVNLLNLAIKADLGWDDPILAMPKSNSYSPTSPRDITGWDDCWVRWLLGEQ
ncbi:hypothetical protein MLD38_031059 [Melastoma candidum]|uniref:Uncharacterized protein n=1 Tax=Melastoma candidum TaxID=119954 RepID=A0ACB9MS13_9MYRT|nr:hypothetical protein MLD38_031059 [Melastoma candidum]